MHRRPRASSPLKLNRENIIKHIDTLDGCDSCLIFRRVVTLSKESSN